MSRSMSLMPRMAANNIRKNGSVYFPYIGVSVFAMFTFFVFGLILKNDIIWTLPKGAYAVMLIQIGYVLLGLIMLPFLYYTNSFLIKRRKRELGLYSVLGLEKKHIGIMMLWESLFLYCIVMVGAIALGLLFSRLIFLLLLNLAKMPVDVTFMVKPGAVVNTLVFYAFVMGLNLFVNLVQVGKSNPVELMGDSRKGEKEPKRIGLWSLAGLAALVLGYRMAIMSQLESQVFTDFFLAVFLVVMGTYFLFTSGSIAFLRILKKKKGFYYRPENFITVSGMLYRMKKNAASLSNICVFSTMVIITVVCTVSVYLGMESILTSGFSRGYELNFIGAEKPDAGQLKQEVQAIAQRHGINLEEELEYNCVGIRAYRRENRLCLEGEPYDYSGWIHVSLMTLEEYNRLEHAEETLQPGEVLLFSSGPDFAGETVSFEETEYAVKRELTDSSIIEKHTNNAMGSDYIIVMADQEELSRVSAVYNVDSSTQESFYYGFWLDVAEPAAEGELAAGSPMAEENYLENEYSIEGVSTAAGELSGEEDQTTQEKSPEEAAIDGFSAEVGQYAATLPGFAGYVDHRERMALDESMYGGLLFIGIFFGAIFLICLLIIMYYKQITEGFEDQNNFEIMQKVGMGDREIRRTIRKQISMVFALPLVGALCHTAVGMRMVYMLLGAIGFFETKLLITCSLGGCMVFALVYSICYKRTSATYYRIVRKMG
ncbi:MAG: hypothetical protein HFH85_03525 [Lachnospiraceae bacterium]|jgi:putative ABC transport system permease protein|nr:hypothetical protein [Lachnospiraceae bacterium]